MKVAEFAREEGQCAGETAAAQEKEVESPRISGRCFRSQRNSGIFSSKKVGLVVGGFQPHHGDVGAGRREFEREGGEKGRPDGGAE